MKRVVLHIDRVVLNGYPRAERQAIVDGLRAEFARHYAEPGAAGGLPGQAHLDRLQAGRVAVPADAEPVAVGRHAARGIVKGLGR